VDGSRRLVDLTGSRVLWELRLGELDGIEHLLFVFVIKGQVPGQHFVKEYTIAPEVDSSVVILALDHLMTRNVHTQRARRFKQTDLPPGIPGIGHGMPTSE
jgi:hypothetical protein